MEFGHELIPPVQLISNITNARKAIVTFVNPSVYNIWQIISFRVSKSYGMYQLNNVQAKVIDIIDDLNVMVDVDTSNFNIFIYPVNTNDYPPITVPVGSGIVGNSIPMTNLACCFDNVRAS